MSTRIISLPYLFALAALLVPQTFTSAQIWIDGVDVGGYYENYGEVETAIVYGGTFLNNGQINDLTYFGGLYEWQPGGSIGTLTLAGSLPVATDWYDEYGWAIVGNLPDWGTVDHIQFADNGLGYITITAFADGTFSGINATSVDFTSSGVNLFMSFITRDLYEPGVSAPTYSTFFHAFDFTGDGFYLSEFLGEMFGTSNISGVENLSDFSVRYNDYWLWGAAIIHDGAGILDNTQYDPVTGWVQWTGEDDSSFIPEPATLMIVGFGLAGLGIARRRRK